MEKENTISNYNIEEVDDQFAIHSLLLVGANSDAVATYNIYSLNSRYIGEYISGCNSPVEIEPYPTYVGMIESHVNRIGIGLEFWKYGETTLYFKSEKPYYRIIQDITKNGWTKKYLPEVIEHLRDQGIKVDILLEDYNEKKQYFSLLLVGKQEDFTQDLLHT